KPEPNAASAKTGDTTKATASPSVTPAQMDVMAGLYWNSDADDFTKVSVDHGQLVLGHGEDLLTLKAFDPGHFHVSNRPWGDLVDFHFLAAASGQPRRLEQSFGGGKAEVLESVEPFAPTAADLNQFVGAYVSEEIDPVYRIVIRDGALQLTRLKHK